MCTCGVQDGPLIGGAEWLGKTGQRGLDEPRLGGHPFGLAVRIENFGHSQLLERRCEAPASY